MRKFSLSGRILFMKQLIKMSFPIIFVVFCSFVLFADEIPPMPFEPFDAGRVYSSEDVEELRTRYYPDDPFFRKQWHLENIGQKDDNGQKGIPGADISMRKAWEVWSPKEEIVIAILDSGLDLLHEDIDESVLWINPGESGLDEYGNDKAYNGIDDSGNGFIDDVHGYNFVHDNANIQEDQYHGTHVGSIISATRNNAVGVSGMNPKIRIMVVKIFGLGNTLYGRDIAKAVRYAVDNGAHILSNSYGTPSYVQDVQDAIKYARDHGVLYVCASGNTRKDLDNPDQQDYPACYRVENQLVVGATDNRDRSLFSNYGSVVRIAAPGQRIFSLMPRNGYRAFSGTSQAAPMVAAAAAMVWSQNPEYNYEQVVDRLLYGADEIYGLGRYVNGGKRLNVANALKGIKGQRLPQYNFSEWVTEKRVIETKHPYQNDSEEHFLVEVPGAQAFRLFFEKIAVNHHGDFIYINHPDDPEPLEIINGRFRNSWSEVIEGDTAMITMYANKYVNAYGFKITKIQYKPE